MSLNDVQLMYEEIESIIESPRPDPLFNDRRRRRPTCEQDLCPNKATTEWMQRDKDGGLYYTYRCDDHPAGEPMIPHLVNQEF
jgi:hypothetical protein